LQGNVEKLRGATLADVLWTDMEKKKQIEYIQSPGMLRNWVKLAYIHREII
jgi:hypothetical protein